MIKFNVSIVFAVIILLTGCDDRIAVVQAEMDKIRNQSPLPIDSAPVFTPVPMYDYAAQQFRNPFLPNSLALELKTMSGKQVFPNFKRQQQPLESYELEKLTMKGSLRNNRGEILALIKTPDGQIEQVQRGNYLGTDQGRIVKITPTQIDLIEIVSDGRDGFVERPRTMVLVNAGLQNAAQQSAGK